MSSRMFAALVALGLVGACSKGEPGGPVTLSLQGLPGLKVQAPSGTEARENALGIGVMLTGPDVSMTIGPAVTDDAESLEDAKKNAEAYSPTNVDGEALTDGYVLTYESETDIGTNYWLVGRREFPGAAYSCGVSSPKKAHQQSAIAICKSLTK